MTKIKLEVSFGQIPKKVFKKEGNVAKKKKLLVGVLIVLASLTIYAVSTLLISVTSGKLFAPPSTPELSIENTIIKIDPEINSLTKALARRDIDGLRVDLSLPDKEAISFLRNLLKDEESQKIFRQFSRAGITIFVSNHNYYVSKDTVFLNAADGVKKAAEWLENSKP